MKYPNYLFITKNSPPVICGVGDYCEHVSRELIKKGYEVSCLVSVRQKATATPVKVLPMIKDFSVFSTVSTVRTIRKLAPDFINLQYVPQMTGRYGFSLAMGILAIAIRLFSKARLTVTFHELYVAFSRNPLMWGLSLMQRSNLPFMTLAAHNLITTSERKKRSLRFFSFGKKIAVIPVGANIRKNERAVSLGQVREAYAPSSASLFMTFGTASRDKDYIGCIKLISAINRKGTDACLVMAGDIGEDPKVLDSLKRCIQDEGMARHIAITGRLKTEELSELLSVSDFFLAFQKSGLTTGSGTLASAFAHGKPVITNRSPGLDPAFRDGTNIFIVDPSDTERAADRAIGLIKDRGLIKNVGDSASRLYNTKLSWEAIAHAIISVSV